MQEHCNAANLKQFDDAGTCWHLRCSSSSGLPFPPEIANRSCEDKHRARPKRRAVKQDSNGPPEQSQTQRLRRRTAITVRRRVADPSLGRRWIDQTAYRQPTRNIQCDASYEHDEITTCEHLSSCPIQRECQYDDHGCEK